MNNGNNIIAILFCSFLLLLISCEKKKMTRSIKEFYGSSKILLSIEGKTIYRLNENLCGSLPSISAFIGSIEKNLFQVPIFHNIGDHYPMELKVYVENLEYPFDRRPDYYDLLDKLTLYQDQINKGAQEIKLIIRITYENKIYSNSWDPEYKIIEKKVYFLQDRTGLSVKNVKITEVSVNCLPIAFKQTSLIRMLAALEGPIVTQDGRDTINLTGTVELYLTSSGL